MNAEITILSTKKLEKHQKQLLLNAGISVIEKDFIEIHWLSFQLKKDPEILLFTSKNAVRSILQNEKAEMLKSIPAICVGIKTKKLLKENGFNVLSSENYAEDLSKVIQQNYKDQHIAFFAGNLRKETLPEMMKKNKISYDEYLVYKTDFIPGKIENQLDGILFFSSSGIESYLEMNTISDEICFCIGTTTAEALKEISKNLQISEEPTVENVIENCIKYFRAQNPN